MTQFEPHKIAFLLIKTFDYQKMHYELCLFFLNLTVTSSASVTRVHMHASGWGLTATWAVGQLFFGENRIPLPLTHNWTKFRHKMFFKLLIKRSVQFVSILMALLLYSKNNLINPCLHFYLNIVRGLQMSVTDSGHVPHALPDRRWCVIE